MTLICVVDDEPGICDLVCRVLETGGFRTVPAADAEQALSAVARERPRVVVTDMVMPGVNGAEMIQTMKGLYSELRILAMSGGGVLHGRNMLEIAVEVGADDVIGKPFRLKELVAKVERLCLPWSDEPAL